MVKASQPIRSPRRRGACSNRPAEIVGQRFVVSVLSRRGAPDRKPSAILFSLSYRGTDEEHGFPGVASSCLFLTRRCCSPSPPW